MSAGIGIFDSGVGGLTVAKAIQDLLPSEDIIYFGDSIHLPYGNKSEKSIMEYSLLNANFLFKKGVKLIVVACNTSSAISLNALKQTFSVPILGVIESGSVAAVNTSSSKSIGVIGTYRTIHSHSYQKTIKSLYPKANVIEKDCSLFVPIIEEGFKNKMIIELVVEEYIKPFSSRIDTLVLGCTHYPLLKGTINKVFPKLKLVDSAYEISKQVKSILEEKNQLNKRTSKTGNIEIYTNDLNEVFERISHKLFPKKKIHYIESYN